ncbi:MAG: FAD:protein FMN transferase [Bacteroidales bacterium]|nr:FAD:protein FMN transferase [Bacteroidales bacterium]
MNHPYFNYYESSSLFHGSLLSIMGTRFDILFVIENKVTGEALWDKIQSELIRLDKLFNRFDPESEVSQINAGACLSPFIVSSEMWDILLSCKKYHQQTNGLFDITLQNFNKVLLDHKDNSIIFVDKDLRIDFGGYAKGYAIEKIKDILIENNVQNSFINFGNSSIFGLGKHPYGDCWSIGIEDPYQKGKMLGEYKLKDDALSTSGNMPSNPKHIVNPFTGVYNEEKKMVSIITKDSVDAEVLSTSLMIAQIEKREEILHHFNTSEIFVYNL